jgi:hypothetical protein
MDTPPRKEELEWERKKWEQEHSVPIKKAPVEQAPKREVPPPPTVPTVKTFQNDVASSIRTGKQSMVTIALAKKRRENEGETLTAREEPASHTLLYAMIGMIVLIIAVGGSVFFITQKAGQSDIPTFNTPTTTPSNLIVASTVADKDKTVVTIADPTTALSQIQDAFISDTEPGIFREIVPTADGARISTATFFQMWAVHMSSSLARILGSEYAIGAYGLAEDSPYVVFSVTSTDRAIAGLLAWEPTLMQDFASLTGKNLAGGTFTDKLIDGVQVRASSGLIYTFPLNGKVIMTTNENTLKKAREVFGF